MDHNFSVPHCVHYSLLMSSNHAELQITHAVSNIAVNIRGPFEKFVDSSYYSESELCGGAVTVSFSKYLPR
jgi:hypothetical protein